MAPILASSTGVAPSAIEDPALRELHSKLCSLPSKIENIPDLRVLANLLEPFALSWPFDEQVDLFHWIKPLNTIDSVLSWLLADYGRNLILVPTKQLERKATLEDIQQCPAFLSEMATTLLQFSAILLHNSSNKSLYNTSMADWIAAANDDLTDAALSVYFNCSLPIQAHKIPQPPPENLTTSNEYALDRLVSLTKGYGSAAGGLGLDWAMATDDSRPLPDGVGHVHFRYYTEQTLRTVELSGPQMLKTSADQPKRRKALLSTAEIFFMLLNESISDQFALLTEIRLARSAHSREGRHAGICRRLQAICTILYTHPEVLNSYFPAQPELIVELVELVKDFDHVMALHTLTALVSRRDGRLSNAALAELGVGKGQYLGLLPALLRSSLSSMNGREAPMLASDDPSIQIGLAFLRATDDEETKQPPLEHILLLTAAVVTLPTGIAALVDCGLLPTLLTIIETSAHKFVSSLASQILETALTSYSPSISAVKALNGVNTLRNRLVSELALENSYSKRTLVYGLLSCLTVLVNHESSRFRELPLESCLQQGGQIAALACNIIAEVTNNDPNVSSVVNYIHSTTLPQRVFDLVSNPEACSELLTGSVNVLFSMALTEAGAEVVIKANPFPSLIRFFYVKEYAMPHSRCLLNEMATAVGTSLEDIMRNVEALKPVIMSALVEGIKQVEQFGKALLTRENAGHDEQTQTDRSSFIHFVQNFGQLLEQVLQHEDHVRFFVDGGGFDAVLSLYEISIPQGKCFLDFSSSLSCPSLSSLHYGGIEESLNSISKCVIYRYNNKVLIEKIRAIIDTFLDRWDENQRLMTFGSEPIFESSGCSSGQRDFLILVANIHWATYLLTNSITAGTQKGNENETSWGTIEKEFTKHLASTDCRASLQRLSVFYRKCLYDVCTVRGQEGDRMRREPSDATTTHVIYRLRIVCAEGAVVRDGVEIDSCSSVGTFEMGDIVDATDRCVNSSGIMRYKTSHGWVSEMTRGQGREPIAEVFQLFQRSEATDTRDSAPISNERLALSRAAAVPGLREVATNILSKGQDIHIEFLSSISRLSIYSLRAIPRSHGFDEGSFAASVADILNLLVTVHKDSLFFPELTESIRSDIAQSDQQTTRDGNCIFIGAILHQFRTLLNDDKRERRLVNFPLLVGFLANDLNQRFPKDEDQSPPTDICVFDMIQYAFTKCLDDFRLVAKGEFQLPVNQIVRRCTAATLPPVISFLRSIVSQPLLSSASTIGRMKITELKVLMFTDDEDLSSFIDKFAENSVLQGDLFVASLQYRVSRLAFSVWTDSQVVYVPPFLLNPLATFIGETVLALEEAASKKPSNTSSASSARMRLSEFLSRRTDRHGATTTANRRDTTFSPDEAVVARVVEMGFSRDHALYAAEMTCSNQLSMVMDYALSSLPPSTATIERLRAERERRQRERQAVAAAVTGSEEDATMQLESSSEQLAPPTESSDSTIDKLLKKEVESWFDVIPRATCDLIGSRTYQPKASKSPGGHTNTYSEDGDLEASTMILSSFLVDLCKKRETILYKVTDSLVEKLMSFLIPDSTDQSYTVETQWVSQLSCVCHALSVLLRCQPTARVFVLGSDAMERLVDVLARTSMNINTCQEIAPWLSPALVLVGLMSQPMAAFPIVGVVQACKESDTLMEVREEHASQSKEIQRVVEAWHSNGRQVTEVEAGKTLSVPFETNAEEVNSRMVDSPVDGQTRPENQIASIPAFYPMLPRRLLEISLEICVQILRSTKSLNRRILPPGLMQSVLVLLLHILRDPWIGSFHLRSKLAEYIVLLPVESKFEGNASLSGLIFKRIIEDPETLLQCMEMEIRKLILKLHASSEGTPRTPVKNLFSSLSHLLIREPYVFMHAMTRSTKIEIIGGEAMAHILNQTQRAALVDHLLRGTQSGLFSDFLRRDECSNRTKRNCPLPKRRAKVAQRNKRVHSKGKKEDHAGAEHLAYTLCSCLMSSVLTLYSDNKRNDAKTFLSISDQLDILADLSLAIPLCANAVSGYRIRSKDKTLRTSIGESTIHALEGAPTPQKTFLNFLLHCLLPQDLWSIRNTPELWDPQPISLDNATQKALSERKKDAKRVLKLVHAAARVVISLAARPSESRKRVVVDLAFALSGGIVSSSGLSLPKKQNHGVNVDRAQEMHAVNAWTELCLAIAAPRSTGRDIEGNGALDVGNIKLLLDHGMFHALLYSMKRLHTEHPMASNTGGLLLLALEILSRGAVTDAVSQLAHKETKRESTESAGPLNDENDATHDRYGSNSLGTDFVVADNTATGMDTETDGSAVMMDGIASNDEDTVLDEYGASDSEGMDDDEEEDDDDSQLDDSDSSSEDSDDEEGWDEPEAFALDDHESPRALSADMMSEGSDDATEYGMGEGWTHVDNDNMEVVNNEGVDSTNRPRHFFDAAEAMIGSLLRNGDISGETLAEIEGSLGIRLVQGGRVIPTNANGNARGMPDTRLLATGAGFQSEIYSDSLPVHQRTQSDVLANSIFDRNGTLGDAGTMEFVYGSPSLMSGGRRNYDVYGIFQEDEQHEEQFSSSELVLFPGGPSSATRCTGVQISVHPLLSEIELPPPNSLVSDLRNHNVRTTQRLPNRRRRIGPWSRPGGSQRRYFSIPGAVPRSTGPVPPLDQRSAAGADPRHTIMLQSYLNVVNSAFSPSEVPPIVNDPAQATVSSETLESNVATVRNTDDQPLRAEHSASDARADSSVGLLDDTSSALFSELRSSLGATDLGARPSAGFEGIHVGDDTITSNVQFVELGDAATSVLAETGEQPLEVEAQLSETVGADEQPNELLSIPDQPDESELRCPPGFEEDVFTSLPREMQLDCVNQYNAAQELASQLDGSSLDPAVLAELPEEIRQEIIEQDRRERQRHQELPPADPTNAQEMDNASIIASMAPELREEVLLTLEEAVLSTLPPALIAEAQVLRDRASLQRRRVYDNTLGSNGNNEPAAVDRQADGVTSRTSGDQSVHGDNASAARKRKTGKIKVDADRNEIVYIPDSFPPPVAASDIKALLQLLFMLSPVRPNRALHRLLENCCAHVTLRNVLTTVLISLLHEDVAMTEKSIDDYGRQYNETGGWRAEIDNVFAPLIDFPPSTLLGAVPEISNASRSSPSFSRQRYGLGAAALLAANSSPTDGNKNFSLQPVVAVRIIDILGCLLKNSRLSVHFLEHGLDSNTTCFEKLLELLKLPTYTRCSTTLEHLLTVVELCVAPLSQLPRQKSDELTVVPSDPTGKLTVDIPRIVVSAERLNILCSLLRLESCRDSGFSKVNGIIRRLCRIEANRKHVLGELASVANRLSNDAYRDLRALRISMERAVSEAQHHENDAMVADPPEQNTKTSLTGTISSSISFSTSTSELKLLRVLQTLQSLCVFIPNDQLLRKSEGGQAITPELVLMLRKMPFNDLWDELSACLKVVQVLEGVKSADDDTNGRDEGPNAEDLIEEVDENQQKRLRNSAAGLLARFLPSIEAFFIANASFTREPIGNETNTLEGNMAFLVEGDRVLQFVSTNKVLLNALLRSNPTLLDKGLYALVQIPRFRLQLSFDVKRHWFKTQIRRLRQQASRRYGSLRLHIRRDSVFQDAFFQLQPRNAEEMRGRLHVTFRNEEGVDAGGLSREFFNILAKEMFNPNYALFTSTEDGCTFQPNPNSMINPDHLSYFRFVGRVVGKALTDGYLMDAHFTRSLYKHMLGLKPTHPDMEAIDPDYYGNLKSILENSLELMGLEDMTFSIEDHSFGRNQVIDLIPNGRHVRVTDDNKEDYVQKVCEHRMTISIQSQIKSYLDGFYEIVNPELIAIFTPRELELLISGLPDINVHDLKENTDYVGWRSSDKEITWFWNVLFSLSRNEKAAFLQFVTGSSKVPLSGFSELQGMRGTQKFSIHRAAGMKGALMSAHTCFNSLDLPVYESEEQTREKLLLAINEGNGAFGFA